MKIREFCMFYNEHTVLEIKIAEARKWIDELHLREANRTFRNKERVPVLPAGDDFVKTHVYDGAGPDKWYIHRRADQPRVLQSRGTITDF